ncbi:hypothetical protein SAMN05661096_00869 [Marivirga sericea]|uniref:Uncharacterized protein n=1 Tax=Marivirga sericea TaxID=1028 RepID=A0A1X7IPG2_9BACT|nr:hypothetical protein [Marivirga sericea]SMG16566.1 hypothetical protein SAMN05661096_00869 [Marivirga sericea]
MSLYLLNLSVDAVDPEASYIPEDLSYNEQESIVEIIVEKILGYENAFLEVDDQDADENNHQNNSSLDFYLSPISLSSITNTIAIESSKLFKEYILRLPIGFKEIDNPPPIC